MRQERASQRRECARNQIFSLQGSWPTPLDAAQAAEGPGGEEALTADIVRLASRHGRYSRRQPACVTGVQYSVSTNDFRFWSRRLRTGVHHGFP
jgi:hypothetical protein